MARRGPKPGTFKKPPGSGRVKGQLSKVTLEIREIAKQYGPQAVAELARIAGVTNQPGSENEQTRVAAIKELLDRGFGRSMQPVGGDDKAPPIKVEYGASSKLNGLIDAIAKRSGEAGEPAEGRS